MTFIGGNPAKLTATEQPLERVPGGVGCGTEAKLDATLTNEGFERAVWVATKNA